MLCAWSGPMFMVVFGVGFWWIAGFVPPPSPSLSAADVAALYQQHTTSIRLGLAIALGSCGLIVPFVGLISAQIRRIQGISPAFCYAQLGAGSAGVLVLIIPMLVLEAVTYRPERDPNLTQMLNDLGWLMFIMPFTLASIQGAVLAAAILLDEAKRPVFPRWVAYFNIWVALLFIPGAVAVFFKSGPFAWNSVFPFWIPLVVFGSWFLVMFVVLRNIVLKQHADAQPA